jgi:tetratricopeptide (TPR) repeat protein
VRAAVHALDSFNGDVVVAHARHAIECGAQGEELGLAHLCVARIAAFRGENAELAETSSRALSLLREDSAPWYDAVDLRASASLRAGRSDELIALGRRLAERFAEAAPSDPLIWASAKVAQCLYLSGAFAAGAALLSTIDAAEASATALSPATKNRVATARAKRALARGNPAEARAHYMDAIEQVAALGDVRATVVAQSNCGWACVQIGLYEEAILLLRRAVESSRRVGLLFWELGAKQNLGLALAAAGLLDEAFEMETEAALGYSAGDNRVAEGISHLYLALILALRETLDAAEAEARAALGMLAKVASSMPFARAVLAHVLLLRGRASDALKEATASIKALAELGQLDEGDAFVRLTYASALHAAGNRTAAAKAILDARNVLSARADEMADPALRRSFLENVPENARTLRLAAEWGALAAFP